MDNKGSRFQYSFEQESVVSFRRQSVLDIRRPSHKTLNIDGRFERVLVPKQW